MDNTISKNLQEIQERIQKAAEECGRDPQSIRLVAVSKTKPAEMLRQAAAAGATIFGENYIQEAREKIAELESLDVEWHFIGHLQSNKIKDMLGFAAMLHSLDRPSLARKLQSALERLAADRPSGAPSAGQPPLPFPVLVQVNTSEEDSKFGCHPEDAAALVDLVESLPLLDLQGFMTIGLFSDDEEAVRRGFRHLREIRDTAEQRLGRRLPELSMGMSGDFELAIAEGATIVRLGSSVFGRRQPT